MCPLPIKLDEDQEGLEDEAVLLKKQYVDVS
jgi:hypothetical protein